LGRRGLLRSKKTEFTALSMTKDVRSPAAEAYRHLRASLLFSTTGEAPRSILVTSGGPFEGKTTTAINTAVTFAQTGAEVLIVDCDLRRPQIHRHFKFSNSDGLTSFLAGEQEIDSLLHEHEDYPNLKLITAGPMPANPAGFLGSDEMRTLMKLLERRFTHIIIDSPPASSFADASLLSTLVDGVIIVVHSKRNSRRAVRRVKERLQELGASVYGVVLNHVDLESKDYYSEYYTSHDY
jgi:polysaccharide biosynthesis transport protein